MKEFYRINLPILLIISFFIHCIVISFWLLPDTTGVMTLMERKRQAEAVANMPWAGQLAGRDIIVNINQDDTRVIDRNTLLSDRDSSARGYITKKKGNRWLNNSMDFRFGQRGDQGRVRGGPGGSADKKKVDSVEYETPVTIAHADYKRDTGSGSSMEGFAIPDKNDVTMDNALYYDNNKVFSYNTAKFKDFSYFRAMKNKIASNWYPPMMANVRIGGYAPGSMRIMAIPSQRVKLYFVMNRAGDVIKVEILDSLGNNALDSSCIDAIKMSKNFGQVPDDMKGEQIVIPFIFGYYSQ